MAPPYYRGSHAPTLLHTVIDVFICFLLAGSYIPQLIRIISSGRGNSEGISSWYIILLTLSASTFLAARLENNWSQRILQCVRDGILRGWKVFPVLLMYFQMLLLWLAAVALLAVYLALRQHPNAHGTGFFTNDAVGTTSSLLFTRANDAQQLQGEGYEMQQLEGNTMQQHSQPSNVAIIAIVCAHAALILPISLTIFIIGSPEDVNWVILIDLFQQVFHGWFLVPSGFLFALAGAAPQIHLIITRSRAGMGLGDLSLLSLGLQVLAFAALGVSQKLRLGWPEWGINGGEPMSVWGWLLFVSGPAVGLGGLAVCQLVVLAVALGVGVSSGGIHL